jgi:hypothetical protein
MVFGRAFRTENPLRSGRTLAAQEKCRFQKFGPSPLRKALDPATARDGTGSFSLWHFWFSWLARYFPRNQGIGYFASADSNAKKSSGSRLVPPPRPAALLPSVSL